jgi:nucleoside-diphosphate-sugar epimerase
MRFDLVLNNLAGLAWTTREIRMESDGTPWRPLVHLLDIARAVACVLEAPARAVPRSGTERRRPGRQLPDLRHRRDRQPHLPGL